MIKDDTDTRGKGKWEDYTAAQLSWPCFEAGAQPEGRCQGREIFQGTSDPVGSERGQETSMNTHKAGLILGVSYEYGARRTGNGGRVLGFTPYRADLSISVSERTRSSASANTQAKEARCFHRDSQLHNLAALSQLQGVMCQMQQQQQLVAWRLPR